MKQSIRTLLMLVAISISCSVARAATPLRNGDLIFQESCRGTMNDAIKGVTTSISGYQFTHVGIVWIHQKDTFVIEATRPHVAITPLKEFLLPEAEKACPPVSVLARMKPRFQSLIPQAIEEARRLGIPVLVDPKGSDWRRYAGAHCVTPNAGEFDAACGLDAGVTLSRPLRETLAGELRSRYGIERLLITRGPKGMALFTPDEAPVYCRAAVREVADVTAAAFVQRRCAPARACGAVR